ncbi:putative cytochrome c oxidase polypeptide VI mitochondrial precursor [Durotheca rogersii]|uniref:putative cytochrome c oxidase polypeptide VI mitochondrial precursor n=1 Tax=Durotheca rogersii TaxID=419775 RepID=UPI00221FF4B3|nr:putative cytochrome c oxidase polypeptide VI mitochondrial precursor [Durotheca rogersii]KAI5867314.1 putative cytochrome c oxidase polypeptide VI mitochondrial precursor [Durotheca rogersii]
MSSLSLLRIASRGPPKNFFRANRPVAPARSSASFIPGLVAGSSLNFSTSVACNSAAAHHEETFEEFTARYESEFEKVQDVFELQRNLNNAFAYDLVPSPSVVEAALRAARRVNDFPTAVRIFEGIKAKVENKDQYRQYLDELKPLREELGVILKEDLYPEESK